MIDKLSKVSNTLADRWSDNAVTFEQILRFLGSISSASVSDVVKRDATGGRLTYATIRFDKHYYAEVSLLRSHLAEKISIIFFHWDFPVKEITRGRKLSRKDESITLHDRLLRLIAEVAATE